MPLLNINLRDAIIIKNKRIYLELLLLDDDYNNILKMCEKNYNNNHIKSFYSRPDIDLDDIQYQNEYKFIDNQFLNLDSNVFDTLLYLIKLNPDTNIQDSQTDGIIIGMLEIYENHSEKCIEFGLFIDKDYARRHYGTETIRTVIKFLKKYSNVDKLVWTCGSDNIGSINVAKNCGFIHDFDEEQYGKIESHFKLVMAYADQ